MNLLITGSSGFLGRRAAAHFTSLGHQVLTPSRTQLDITDKESINAWFHQHRPRAVLHCAAVSDTGKCQKDPENSALVNVTGSINLAAGCRQYGAKLIFCSSDQVYAGSSLQGPHRESEPLTPGNEYAKQKLLAEQQCAALCPDMVSLRLSWMYATQFLPGEHGHLLVTLVHAFQDEHMPLTWPIHDHRGITDVDSVVRQLPSALELPAGVYNFGAENHGNTYQTMHAVFESLGLDTALKRMTANDQAFADSPRDIRMNTALAQSYGIHFESTQEGLSRALRKCLQF